MNEVASFTIRNMQEADLDSVYAIEKEAHITPWSEGIFKDCLRVGYGAKVLEINRKIIGFVLFSNMAGECHLLNLCIEPSFQGLGYGKSLLTHLIEIAKLSFSKILLEVRVSNFKAIALYKNYDFKEIGLRKGYYKLSDTSREDAVVLELLF